VALVDRYADEIRGFGQLPFQKEVGKRRQGGGNPERFALLNEDQALFLLTLSRNTDRVVALKAQLVRAFRAARKAAELRQVEYLPAYHALHDAMHAIADGTPNEHFVHMNLNKLVNKAAGIRPGGRPRAGVPQQAMLIVAQHLAAQALQGAPDHRTGYERVKAALDPLRATLPSLGAP